MKQKCEWCHNQDGLKEITVEGTVPFTANKGEMSFFVCPGHEEKLCRFYDRVRRHVALFLILLAALVLIIPLSGLLVLCLPSDNCLIDYLFMGSFAYLGLVICIFPFCSPTTYKLMSIATSLILTRVLGGLLFAVGVVGIVLALLQG